MSKTSQENKAKKAKKELEVEVQSKDIEQKAVTTSEKVVTEDKTETEESPSTSKKVKISKIRGKKYLAAKKQVDVTKYYSIKEAVKLIKTTSFSKFEGKVEAHLLTTESGNLAEITFPHLETTTKKVVILNDAILKEIKDSKLNFDILIATPTTMPKLLPLAKVLGPKGLMPNLKNGTLTDDPQAAVKKLSAAKTVIRTEKKAPVVHIVVAKVSQAETEIEANITELISAIKANRIKKLAICATMGPCIKIQIDK